MLKSEKKQQQNLWLENYSKSVFNDQIRKIMIKRFSERFSVGISHSRNVINQFYNEKLQEQFVFKQSNPRTRVHATESLPEHLDAEIQFTYLIPDRVTEYNNYIIHTFYSQLNK